MCNQGKGEIGRRITRLAMTIGAPADFNPGVIYTASTVNRPAKAPIKDHHTTARLPMAL